MIYVVLIYFMLLLIWTIQRKYWGVSVFMVALYLFSLFFSVLLVTSSYNNITPGVIASIIYCVALTLLFSPYFIKKPIIKAPTYKEIKTLVRLFSVISFFFIIADFVILPAVSLAYAAGANEIRSTEGGQTFYTVLTGYRSFVYFFISSFFGLSYLLLMMFFYAFAFIKGKIWFKVLLLIASLTAPYLGILDGGRTNMTYWVLFAITSFIIFRPYFPKGVKVKTYILMAIPFAILISLFITASVDRFEYRDGGIQGGLIAYAGQSYVNFCDFVDRFRTPSYTLQRIFPRLSSFVSGEFDLGQYREYVMRRSGMDIGIFYTLLGDLLVDVGFFGMFLYVLFYRGICKGTVNKKSLGLSDIILLSLLLQIPIHGVFYYSLWSIKASNTIVLTIILYFYFKIKSKQSSY